MSEPVFKMPDYEQPWIWRPGQKLYCKTNKKYYIFKGYGKVNFHVVNVDRPPHVLHSDHLKAVSEDEYAAAAVVEG